MSGDGVIMLIYPNSTIVNSIFINNKANGARSTVYLDNSLYTSYDTHNQSVINCTFINNIATGHGGAIMNYLGHNIIIIGNKIYNNTAGGNGGSIYNMGDMFLAILCQIMLLI